MAHDKAPGSSSSDATGAVSGASLSRVVPGLPALPRVTPDATPMLPPDADVSTFVGLVQGHGCRVVAFDMDQTIVTAHARGRLRRDDLHAAYAQRVAPDFVRVVPALREAGIGLAIATWSDKLRYLEVCGATGLLCP